MSNPSIWNDLTRLVRGSWYECPICHHKIKLHIADSIIGCAEEDCPNIGLALLPCEPPKQP